LLTTSWTGFLAVVSIIYVAINILFALAYLACGPNALIGASGASFGGTFGRAFFFSIETFATIGYGQIAPDGVAANLVVTVEALVGLMYQALATGLLFARFTRPTAALLFSHNAVVGPYRDGEGLMFRIVNGRRNEIIELEAQVLFSAMENDGLGGTVRRYTPLALERNKVTFFPLAWTIVHPIDNASPLAGRTAEDLERTAAEILVLLSGVDEALEQTVHVRSSYRADEIIWHARFRSMFLQPGRGSTVSVDISRVHEIERV
jgi:inward rectifier potassium channel